MIYNKLYLNILIRVILIIINCFVLVIAYIKINDLIININLIALIILQGFLFIKSLNKVNSDLVNFFSSIKNEDSTLIYSDKNDFNSRGRRLPPSSICLAAPGDFWIAKI